MARTESRIVVFDSSALEARYLAPLLRGEHCADFRLLTEAGYQPAVLRRTITEIWLHAKLGSGNSASWAKASQLYPGPLSRMMDRIRHCHPSCDDPKEIAYLWFNLAEEWRGREVTALAPIQREFLAWKCSIESFCTSIQSAIQSGGLMIAEPRAQHPCAQEVFSLEQEIALHSLIPNEDLLWIIDAALIGARAIVLSDNGVLIRGRLSLGFNIPGLCTVHPDALRDAVRENFDRMIYPKRANNAMRATCEDARA